MEVRQVEAMMEEHRAYKQVAGEGLKLLLPSREELAHTAEAEAGGCLFYDDRVRGESIQNESRKAGRFFLSYAQEDPDF